MGILDNCFTFTYKSLVFKGYDIPSSWETWTVKDMRKFIKNYKWFLENKKHIEFFESFCFYTNEATENDIIINDKTVGLAINRFKYITIKEKNGKVALCNIKKEDKILRIENG